MSQNAKISCKGGLSFLPILRRLLVELGRKRSLVDRMTVSATPRRKILKNIKVERDQGFRHSGGGEEAMVGLVQIEWHDSCTIIPTLASRGVDRREPATRF